MAEIALYIVLMLILIPSAFLFVEVWWSGLPFQAVNRSKTRGSIGVIVPAHNEELCIERTLNSIKSQLADGDTLLVVADNCTDSTAQIAEMAGATVVRRVDASRRGKGYALNYGIRMLDLLDIPHKIVIIIDADCELGKECLSALAICCEATGRPIQGKYIMRASDNSKNVLNDLARFAFHIRCVVRPMGLRRLGLPCQLNGTGMAFPRDIFSQVETATGHLVEDVKLGIELILAGYYPLFCPEAVIVSAFPENPNDARTQRERWAHGYLSAMIEYVPVVLGKAVRRKSIRLLGFMLDLCIPPLGLLAIVTGFVIFVASIYCFINGLSAVAILAILVLTVQLAAIGLSWSIEGREIITVIKLLVWVPIYVLKRVPIDCQYLFRRQAKWIRTGR